MTLSCVVLACAVAQAAPYGSPSFDRRISPTQMAVPVPPIPTVPAFPTTAPSAPAFGAPAAPVFVEGADLGQYLEEGTGGLFRSDRAFEGFVGPLSDIIQAKDARSLTEARFHYFGNYGRPGTPVLGNGTYQVYALQLRLAVTDRLQLFADKDGIARVSPQGGRSVTGLANIAAGAKYVFIRDVENQFLLSGAIQYEAPTGYANIYQNQGSGLLGVYAIAAKQFGDDWHVALQAGQNIALQNQQNGYFFTHAHVDRRFGKFVPLYEVNWFYYNGSAKFLPPIGLEGGGLLDLGTAGMSGHSIVTSTVGAKYNLTGNVELGLGYQFAMQKEKSLYGDSLLAQVILRY